MTGTPEWRKPKRSYGSGNCVEVAAWRKPGRSMNNGNCVEVGNWRKSSRSANHGACVEAGNGPSVVLVRDTKAEGRGPVLEFSPDAWREFGERLKAGAR